MAKHVTYRLRLLIVAMLVAVSANAQQLGLKTNLLYWATTTPNVGLELQTGRKHSVQAFYGINPWKFNDNKSIRHWMVQRMVPRSTRYGRTVQRWWHRTAVRNVQGV